VISGETTMYLGAEAHDVSAISVNIRAILLIVFIVL